MRQTSVIITLGIIHIILLSLFGMYFYRLKHSPSIIPEEKRDVQMQEIKE